MESTPDYSKYSLDDLCDVERRINRERYPERYQQVVEQIAIKQRAPSIPKTSSPDEKCHSRLVLRIVAAIEMMAGIGGLITGALLLLVTPAHPILVAHLFGFAPLLSIVAGVLLWKEHRYGLPLSLWLQAAQVPILKTAAFSYFVTSGLYFRWTRTWLDSNGSIALEIGVNFVAIGLLWALVLQRQKQHQTVPRQ